MQDYRQFLTEYRRLAGLQEAPETSRRGRGRNVMPADRPGNETAPPFDNSIEMQMIGDRVQPSTPDSRQAEPVTAPISPQRVTVIPTEQNPDDRAFNPNDATGGARFLPGRAAQTRIDNPPDPRLQSQFARSLADFIPGVGAAASGYDAARAALQGDYLGAAGNLGTAVAQTVLPGGAMTAVRAAAAPFRQAVQSGTAKAAGAGITGATRAERAAGTAGVSTSIAAPMAAGSTQADGDAGEAEARAAESTRQQNIRLAGSTQADGNAGEAEARARIQADQALERSRQAQADISTGGYSGGRTAEVPAGGSGIIPGSQVSGLKVPAGTTFSPQVMQGTLPSQISSVTPTPSPIPAPASTTTSPAPQPQMYQIGKGDTLSQIAAKAGTSVAEIMRLNPQITNPDRIGIGQKINITGATPAATYAGGVGTVADTQAKIKAGVYTPDTISAQAAQRAAASSTGMPNLPGSGPAQMTGKMVPTPAGSVSQPAVSSAISQGVNQAIASKPPTSQSAPTNAGILPAPLQPGQLTSFISNKPTGQPDREANFSGNIITTNVPSSVNTPPAAGTNLPSGNAQSRSMNVNQAGFDAAQARVDRRAAEMKAQRDASPEWQNASTVTTTNPDGSTTKTKEASWTTPPNPNAAALNTTTGNKDNFQESISKIKLLAGLMA